MNESKNESSYTKTDSAEKGKPPNRMRSKNLKKELEDITQLSNILESQDIDQMLKFLRSSGQMNKHSVLDLNPYFIHQHANGVEMFMKMAIRLEPDNPDHHYNFALFLQNEKLYDEAKKEFQMAIKLDGDKEVYHMDYGNLLFFLKDYENTEKHFKAAMDLKPEDPNIWTNLGILYSKNNENKKAITALKTAINLDPNYPLSYLNLLQLYRRQDMAAEAQSLWKKYQDIEIHDLGINILHLDEKKSE